MTDSVISAGGTVLSNGLPIALSLKESGFAALIGEESPGTFSVIKSNGGTLATSGGGGGGGSSTVTLAAGTANAGTFALSNGSTVAVTGTVAVSGAFYQATQPVSGSVTLAAGAANVGTFALATGGSVTLTGSNSVTLSNVGVIGAATAPAYMLPVGAVYNSTALTLTAGQSAALQCDASGALYTHANGGTQAASIVAQSSGGMGWSRSINGANSAMATMVKASAGQVYSIDVSNGGSVTVYFRLYNLASTPTPGSATGIVKTVAVPAGGSYVWSNDVGMALATGIAYDVTSGSFADSDSTVISAASTVSVTLGTK